MSFLDFLTGSDDAERAANIAADADTRAARLAYQMYLQNRYDLSPYREGGGAAFNQLLAANGLPQQDFTYQPPGRGVGGSGGFAGPVGGPGGGSGSSAADAAGELVGGYATNALIDRGLPMVSDAVGVNLPIPLVSGVIAGLTGDGSKAARAGRGVGTTIGTAFGGPIGGTIGGFIGDKLGGSVRDRDDRLQVYYNPADRSFFNEEGQLVGRWDDSGLIDLPGDPYPGYRQISGISLDGHPVLVDAEGNLRTGQNGSGLYDPGINLAGLNDISMLRAANGQGITNTRGGELGAYDPVLDPFLNGGGGGNALATGGAPSSLNVQPDGSVRPGADQGVAAGPPQGDWVAGTGGDPNDPYGPFRESPGYRYREDRANRAVDRSMAARGLSLSGAQLQAAQRNAADIASQEYNDWWNRTAQLAGVGQTATQNAVQSGNALIPTVASNISGAGASRASGYVQRGNARVNLANNALAAALPWILRRGLA